MKSFGAKAVFLVGVGRSGTTLAQSLIGSHPSVLTFPETSFFCHAYGHYNEHRGSETRVRSSKRYIRTALGLTSRNIHRQMEATLNALDEPLARSPLGKGYRSAKRAVRAWAHVLSKISEERGFSVWLEKTPMHIGYIPEITSLIEGVSFIHLIRSPEAVIASRMRASREYDAWRNASSLEENIRVWNRAMMITREYAKHPKHIVVRYESLLMNTELVLNQIFSFMDLEQMPLQTILERRAQVAESIILPNEHWKEKCRGPVLPSVFSDHQFSNAELNIIRENCVSPPDPTL